MSLVNLHRVDAWLDIPTKHRSEFEGWKTAFIEANGNMNLYMYITHIESHCLVPEDMVCRPSDYMVDSIEIYLSTRFDKCNQPLEDDKIIKSIMDAEMNVL